MVIAIEGPSAIGKTTVSRELARQLSAHWLPEAYDRLRPRPDLRVPDRRSLLRTELRLIDAERKRYEESVSWRQRGSHVVTDTGFLGPLTYSAGIAALDVERDIRDDLARRALRDVHVKRLGLPELEVVLTAPATVLRRRARREPRGHPKALVDRHLAVGRFELGFWRTIGRGPLKGRIVFVRADAPPAVIVARIHRAIHRWKPLPLPGPRLAGVVVRLLSGATGGRSRLAPARG